MSEIILTEIVTPATPAANKVKVYVKAGGKLFILDDLGVESELLTTTALMDDCHEWLFSGAVMADAEIDGFRIMERAGTIQGVVMSLGDRGETGDNIIDIHKHVPAKPITVQRNNVAGAPIYTTQANRPTLAGLDGSTADNAIIQATDPDALTFLAGDFFSVDVDQIQTDASDLVVQLYVRYD